MGIKVKFNENEALKLWKKGWCWGALGEKYGYHKRTIKKYVAEFASIEEYSEANRLHCKNHRPFCPLCCPKEAQKRKLQPKLL
ncbi:MAG: hypothetical protein U9O94_05000 [Nanoarchaeota archaeon]|nr:hypothetical protein [Nanoarchaeota archaeon]